MNSTEKKDVSKFVRLTKPHHRQLYGIAVALCRDRDKAADLTQEALIRAFQAFERFRRDAPVLPWLRRILRNVYLDSFKTGQARHEVTESELSSTSELHTIAASAVDPLAVMERSQLSGLVREEISRLDPSHQQVLELCVMQELSFAEAAEIADIPVGTVASRLARARASLRDRVLRRVASIQRQERTFWDSKGVVSRTRKVKRCSSSCEGRPLVAGRVDERKSHHEQ